MGLIGADQQKMHSDADDFYLSSGNGMHAALSWKPHPQLMVPDSKAESAHESEINIGLDSGVRYVPAPPVQRYR